MYIRRKVFSSVYDEETGEERLFSTTEFMNEETYLEQRAYAEEAEEDAEAEAKKAKAKKIAKIAGISAGGAAGVAGAGIYGSKKLGKMVSRKAMGNLAVAEALGDAKGIERAEKALHIGRQMEKPANKVSEAVGKGAGYVSKKAKAAGEWTKGTKAGQFTKKQAEKLADVIANNPKAVKALKVGGIATASTAAAAGLGYGGYKGYKAYKAKKEAKESAE